MTPAASRRVRIPGKLMLAGEYAVLAGAPAIVACVDRYVRVRVDPATGGAGAVTMPGFDAGTYRYEVVEGVPRWATPDTAPTLVDAVLRASACGRPMRIDIDTTALFDDGRKLGLGSSAAVAVALATALAPAADPVAALPVALAAHRAFQAGAGSGADLRAVAHGGVIVQAGVGDAVTVEALRWPPGLVARPVGMARSADTVDRVGRFARWRDTDPGAAAVVGGAVRAAKAVAAEWRRASPQGIIDAMQVFTHEVDRMDRAAGLGYREGGHDRAGAIAAAAGCAYKPCGAGGGDLGIAFASSPEPLERFVETARAAGFDVPDLAVGSARPETTTEPAR